MAAQRRAHAPIFAALGDETRLLLIAKLAGGRPRSISQMTEGSRITRQAVSKHLRVLECAGIVRGVRCGRENRFEFDPAPIQQTMKYLDLVAEQWEHALLRLKNFVED
jgi:DNA-binding transcriptional ArsR family regulator